MSHRTATAYYLPIVLLLLAIAVMAPSPASAQGVLADGANQGILGAGPSAIMTSFLPLVQSGQGFSSERQCPFPVGDGCLGDPPVILDKQPAPAAQLADGPETIQQFYLPLLGS